MVLTHDAAFKIIYSQGAPHEKSSGDGNGTVLRFPRPIKNTSQAGTLPAWLAIFSYLTL